MMQKLDGYLFKNNEMECGTAGHVLLCVWSSFVIICLVIGVVLRASSQDIYQHHFRLASKIRSNIHNIDAKFALFRLSAMMIAIILAQYSGITAAILLFMAFFVPICYTINQLPYVNMRYNFLRCSMDSFNFWLAFSLLILVAIGDNKSYVGFVIWCLFPVFIIICCILCKIQLKNRPLSNQDLRFLFIFPDAFFDILVFYVCFKYFQQKY